MSFKNLTLEFQSSIAVVTLQRPSQRNALSLELMQELIGLLGVLQTDADVRCIILGAAAKRFALDTIWARWWDVPSATIICFSTHALS